jgi:hypothetical protein
MPCRSLRNSLEKTPQSDWPRRAEGNPLALEVCHRLQAAIEGGQELALPPPGFAIKQLPWNLHGLWQKLLHVLAAAIIGHLDQRVLGRKDRVFPLGLVLGHLTNVVHVARRFLRQDHDLRSGLDHLVHQNRIAGNGATAKRAQHDGNGVSCLCRLAQGGTGNGHATNGHGADKFLEITHL